MNSVYPALERTNRERILDMARAATNLNRGAKQRSLRGLVRERFLCAPGAPDSVCTEMKVFEAAYGAQGGEYWRVALLDAPDHLADTIALHLAESEKHYQCLRASKPVRALADHLLNFKAPWLESLERCLPESLLRFLGLPERKAAKPARAKHEPRPRGRKPVKRLRVVDEMREFMREHGPEVLKAMTEEAMSAQFNASRDVCRKARDAALSEIVGKSN